MSSTTAVRERPILFSGPMVRAILEGRKSQTRRTVKPQPCGGDAITPKGMETGWIVGRLRDSENAWRELRCPYGQPGDHLFVRESAWFHPANPFTKYGAGHIQYDADLDDERRKKLRVRGWKKRPSIHLPRKRSRLTLEVTGVRVERLQDISEKDAVAEGITQEDVCPDGFDPDGFHPPGAYGYVSGLHPFPEGRIHVTAREAYEELWNSINGDGAWAINPFVWVISFTPLPTSAKGTT